jgi:hypothetical protein
MTLRFLTFFAYTLVFFGIWRMFTKQKFSRIRNLTRIAILPTLGNAGMSLYFFALAYVPPSMHLTILRFNTLLLPVAGKGLRSVRLRFELLLFGLILVTAGFFLHFDPSLGPGIAISIVTMLFYTFYSLTTEHSLQQHKINIRYPYLLLHIGLLSGVLGLAMIRLQPLSQIWNSLTLPVIVYVVFCICLSHTCYSALLKTARFKHFTDLLLLEVPLTIALEVMILGIVLSPLVYGVIGCILLLLLYLRIRARKASH